MIDHYYPYDWRRIAQAAADQRLSKSLVTPEEESAVAQHTAIAAILGECNIVIRLASRSRYGRYSPIDLADGKSPN